MEVDAPASCGSASPTCTPEQPQHASQQHTAVGEVIIDDLLADDAEVMEVDDQGPLAAATEASSGSCNASCTGD